MDKRIKKKPGKALNKTIPKKIYYSPSVHEIPYQKLYTRGIRNLIFDFDDTLGKKQDTTLNKKTLALIKELQKKFTIYIFSNNFIKRKKRTTYFKEHNIIYKKTNKPFNKEKNIITNWEETIIIGDKLLTDGLYSKANNIPCILVKKKLFIKEVKEIF